MTAMPSYRGLAIRTYRSQSVADDPYAVFDYFLDPPIKYVDPDSGDILMSRYLISYPTMDASFRHIRALAVAAVSRRTVIRLVDVPPLHEEPLTFWAGDDSFLWTMGYELVKDEEEE